MEDLKILTEREKNERTVPELVIFGSKVLSLAWSDWLHLEQGSKPIERGKLFLSPRVTIKLLIGTSINGLGGVVFLLLLLLLFLELDQSFGHRETGRERETALFMPTT